MAGQTGVKKTITQVCCVPRRVSVMNELISEDMNDPRRKILLDSCFDGLYLVKSQPITSEVVLYLLSKWDPSRSRFVLADGNTWEMRNKDICRVYSLPYGMDKKPIDINTKEEELSYADTILGRYNIGINTNRMISEPQLRTLLQSNEMKQPQNALDFWRFYVLYALLSLLIPSTTNAISGKYLIYLRSKSSAKTFNWCALVMDNLVHSLNKFVERSGKNPRPSGDFHCLVHMFYDMMRGSVYKDRGYTCSEDRTFNVEDLVAAFEKIPCLHAAACSQMRSHERIHFLERTIETCKQEIEEKKNSLCKYEAELTQLKAIANQGEAKRPRRCPGSLLSTFELKTEYLLKHHCPFRLFRQTSKYIAGGKEVIQRAQNSNGQ